MDLGSASHVDRPATLEMRSGNKAVNIYAQGLPAIRWTNNYWLPSNNIRFQNKPRQNLQDIHTLVAFARPHSRLGKLRDPYVLVHSRPPCALSPFPTSLYTLRSPQSLRASSSEQPAWTPTNPRSPKPHRQCALSHAEEAFNTEDTNPQLSDMEKGWCLSVLCTWSFHASSSRAS